MTTHPKLTLDIVRPVMRQIALEMPDKTVPSMGCQYATELQTPGCLVGHALHRLGWSVEELANLDTAPTARQTTDIGSLINYGRIEADDEAKRYLVLAQIAQDRGQTWMDSVTAAEKGRML